MDKELELPLDAEGRPEDNVLVDPIPAPTDSPAGEIVEPDPLESIRRENAALRDQLNELVRMTGRREDRIPPVQPVVEARPPAEVDFTADVDVADLFDRPGPVLNKLMNKVFQAGREAALQDLPALVQQHTAQSVDLRMKAKQFWDEHKDLTEFADFVGLVANTVAQEHPSMNIDEVYKETARRSRERLKLIQNPSAAPSTNPALPAPRGGRKPAVEQQVLTGEAKEMSDMWQAFGG